MSVWTNEVPTVNNGDPVNAESVNKSTEALAAQTQALKQMIDAIRSRMFIAAEEMPLESSVQVGHIVYLNADSQTCEKSLARWQDLNTNGGHIAPEASAVHLGLVIKKDSAYAGDVLTEGLAVLDPAALATLFGSASPVPGVYYLSATDEGTVVEGRPATASRAVQYLGNGMVRVFPPQNEPITHDHKTYQLIPGDWLHVAGVDPLIVPIGAEFYYDSMSPASLLEGIPELVLAAVGEASFHEMPAGTLVPDALYLINEHGVWWIDPTAPVNNLRAHATIADAKEVKIVHSISSPSKTLSITESGGRVHIDAEPLSTTENTPGYLVVKNIADGVQYRGPIVEQMTVGQGLTLSSSDDDGHGIVGVGLAVFDNLRLSAQLVNLNNAITSVEGAYTLTLMPANRAQSINYRVSVPNLGTADHKGRIYMTVLGPANSQPLPDITINLLEEPDITGSALVLGPVTAFDALPATPDPAKVYLIEIDADIQLVDLGNTIDYGRGQIHYKIEFTAPPGADLKILDTGLRIIQE